VLGRSGYLKSRSPYQIKAFFAAFGLAVLIDVAVAAFARSPKLST
jgi:hypothetical protein